MQTIYDVVIAGSGAAGLYTALSLDERFHVLVLSKKEPDIGNSAYAQGGVAAVLNREDDTRRLHFEDTVTAGGGTNDPEAVRVLVNEGTENVLRLEKLGVHFDKNADGRLNLTLEGGHRRRRIAHHKDTTGAEIVRGLLAQAVRRPNIDLCGSSVLMRLERTPGGFCAGVLQNGVMHTVQSRFFVLATGGIGRVFAYTTNSPIATGDGIFFARQLGAQIKDLSLVQFHPTAFAAKPVQERFLISESVRGEGAFLLNGKGERFMPGYDRRAELAPRDVVSRCMRQEQQKTGDSRFYLDITHKDPDFVKNRFPAIYKRCLSDGVDITRERIPVYPCQHYLMGGIHVDTSARTNIPGLYAVGECSHTGVHGNNRLASNSLLEALVFSRRAAGDMMDRPRTPVLPAAVPFAPEKGRPVPETFMHEIQQIVQDSFFIVPFAEKARGHLERVRQIEEELQSGGYAETPERLEAQSLAAVAKIILTEVANA